MSVTDLINRDCTIVRRSPGTQRDDYGNKRQVETLEDAVCELQQRRTTERDAAGEVSDTDWIFYFGPDVDLNTAAAVVVDGDVFELVGDPWPVRSPFTQTTSHVEVKARRTAGAADAS